MAASRPRQRAAVLVKLSGGWGKIKKISKYTPLNQNLSSGNDARWFDKKTENLSGCIPIHWEVVGRLALLYKS